MAYDIVLNFNISCVKEGIYPVQRPSIPAPTKRYNKYKIQGRDGELYEDTGYYDDIIIKISFNYIGSTDEWFSNFRKYKKMFSNAKTIQFNDDNQWFYKVKKIEIGTNARNSKKIGKFDVKFTLDPYCYLISGNESTELIGEFTNLYDVSMPVYRITGNGTCHLIVNGIDCMCSVTNHLIIDTARRVSYKDDGTSQNTCINKDYDMLWLLEGDNTIEITEGFSLEVTPNWRCL